MVKIKQINGEWTVLPDRSPEGMYMDGYLYQNLTHARPLAKKDWDLLFILDGRERAGKSVLCQQMAVVLDPTLDISRICFTADTFKKAVQTAKPGQAVIYDDAYSGLSARGAMTFINQMLVDLLTKAGAKNLYLFIVLPCIFELDKYPAIHRSTALIHVYAPAFERGYFKFYSFDKKKTLYMKGKKFYEYRHVKPDFSGRFTKGYVVDEEAYREKKAKDLNKVGEQFFSGKKYKEQRDSIIRALHDQKWTGKQISELMGKYASEIVGPRGIQQLIKRAERQEQDSPNSG